jgi:hypothetical protein
MPDVSRVQPPRRILVCGSRNWHDTQTIRERLTRLIPPEPWADEPTIVHGDALGADRIAASVALDLGLWVEAHPANWRKHGKAAGPIRNNRMLDSDIDLVLAFQRAGSRGTQHTIDGARRRGIPVEVFDA